MATRCLQKLSDFDAIGSADVEAFLTDLAVDGGVAASTQDQAFYGLEIALHLVKSVAQLCAQSRCTCDRLLRSGNHFGVVVNASE